MIAKVVLLSQKQKEINKFINKFYNSNFNLDNSLSWRKNFSNPVEISELIAAYIDNRNSFDINMWVSLDKNVFINISSSNGDTVIKYLFERYPY